MLNHFNFCRFGSGSTEYLITNDLGAYMFLSGEDFIHLVRDAVDASSELSAELVRKGFVGQGSGLAFVEGHLESSRISHCHTFCGTSLHIFVLTTNCNLNCVYCQASSPVARHCDMMSMDVAKQAVDVALSSPSRFLSFEFQGGEPTLNFECLRYIVEYTESLNHGKDVSFSLVTNLTLLSEEMVLFLRAHNVSLSTSLDGSEVVHDENRPFKDGRGSFQQVVERIRQLQSQGLNIGAIQTTTRACLSRPHELIQAYLSAGLHAMFVRPMSPLGQAGKVWDRIGYTATEFVDFYGQVLDEIIELNLHGVPMREGHAAVLLRKIFCEPAHYMDLRSPCGAGFGQLAYTPSGDVYTCDEGRMLHETGDDSFRLGNVFHDTYREMVGSKRARSICIASVTESIPSCCDCVYRPYCGVCPLLNYALDGDLVAKSPNGYRCGIYKGMLDKLFSLLALDDPEITEILSSWIE